MSVKVLDAITLSDIAAQGISNATAEELYQKLSQIIRLHGPGSPATWNSISKSLLTPNLPFSIHQMMYYGCYRDFGPDPPAWIPDLETASLTNVGEFLERRGTELLGVQYKDPISSFSHLQLYSVSNPEAYWEALLIEMRISFSVPPWCILSQNSLGKDPGHPGGEWLPGAVLNPAENCLSSNRKRSLNDVMIIWRNEDSDNDPVRKMTLEELRNEIWVVAYAVDTLGLNKGSSIAIDMPMNVYSVIIYLAIVLAGYTVVSIADSFAPREIATRLSLSDAKAIFTQDVIIRGEKSLDLYSRVVDAQAPMAIVVSARESKTRLKLRDRDIHWQDFLSNAKCPNTEGGGYSPVQRPVEAFTNILFSSGTTGDPKAIPWTQASPLKAAADAWCHMDVREGDVVCWPTNLGWMMGPWLIYASLLNGASMALYNGSPLGSGFAQFVQDAKVSMLGVIPSIVRSWKGTNCTDGYDWSSIRCFASTGEASNEDEYLWLMGRAWYKPIIEYCGGTEISGAFLSGSMLQTQSLSAFSTPAMGCTLFILNNDDGHPIETDQPGTGEVALGPCMFGASTMLLNADHHEVYFAGMPRWNGMVLRRHGDMFERTARGYYRAHGRSDDTMNLGGIKVSSVEIERICNGADGSVVETAAVGVPPLGGGSEKLILAVVLKGNDHRHHHPDHLRMSFNSALQKRLNPLFKVHCVVFVPSLPRTASNKVMRRVLRCQFFTRLKSQL